MSGSAGFLNKQKKFLYLVGSPKVGGAGDGKHKKKYGHPNKNTLTGRWPIYFPLETYSQTINPLKLLFTYITTHLYSSLCLQLMIMSALSKSLKRTPEQRHKCKCALPKPRETP